jgi:beta-lactamase superfamily II metal-dependent hydrolase
VLDSKFPSTTATYERYLEAIQASGAEFVAADPGQTFDLGGRAVITVLSPIKPFFTQSELRSGANEPNANSVVMRLDHGNFSMLFTGDAEAETEARMMAGGANLTAKVLKVGHHGSRYASSVEFLRAVSAQSATISVGNDNNYGHPSPEALRRLRDARVRPYRTDLQGQITITSNGSTHRITTERTATDAALFRGRRPRQPE